MPPEDFVLFRNSPIVDAATSNTTSQVGEPSVSNCGRVVFYTGNWYASVSNDGGGTWRYINPYTTFPAANSGFCCDQVTIYDASRDLVFWLLQYSADANRNTLRLAIARGADAANNRWYYYDFTPDGVNSSWTGQWFDFPDLALSRNFLYVTSNMFQIGGGWTRCVVLRLPLDQLASAAALSYRYFQTTEYGSLRCTQGALDAMYFASHASNSELRVFSWPESADSPTGHDVTISTWNDGTRSAPGPDGRDWCGRADRRITGAWHSGGVIGFMWSAAPSGTSRPFPYVKVARIRASDMTLIDQPDIWHTQFAWIYPAVGVNDRGHLGISVFYGGGALYPSHAVGISDDLTSGGWSFVRSAGGSHGPSSNRWGDYLACRRHSPDGLTWIASGFTQDGGSDAGNILPRYVHFGRRRDEAGMRRWIGQ